MLSPLRIIVEQSILEGKLQLLTENGQCNDRSSEDREFWIDVVEDNNLLSTEECESIHWIDRNRT